MYRRKIDDMIVKPYQLSNNGYDVVDSYQSSRQLEEGIIILTYMLRSTVFCRRHMKIFGGKRNWGSHLYMNKRKYQCMKETTIPTRGPRPGFPGQVNINSTLLESG
uniref:Uncharacterized protein n=1 Tax=Romanomermis culicivorax TaxID=13658 RepID=A0A915K222_ROMCU